MISKPTLIAVAQMAPRLADLDANLSRHLELAQQAAELGAELIVFPELSLTGYLMKDLTADVAQNISASPMLDALAEASKRISILAGYVEEGDSYIYYNSAAYFEDGRLLANHRKVYLPTYGMFDEERYFSPGQTFRAFDTRFGRCAVLLCEDYWHPSSVYLAAQDGALVMFNMANAPLRGLTLPDEITSVDVAERVAQISAQVYGTYVVYANRVGVEDGVTFSGNSQVVSPTGSVVAIAAHHEEELLLAELDPDQIRRARIFFPLMGDEKLDLVHRELSRIRAKKFKLETEKQ